MNTILKYLKVIGIILIIILLSSLIVTILNYFNILKGNILNIIRLIIPIISLFYGGYKTGSLSLKKGYLEGLKIGIIYVALTIIFNLIFNNFTWISLIYDVILIGISILGSMIGINRKRA